MHRLIAEDQVQFDRLKRTITAILARPAADQARIGVLLAALRKEEMHILTGSRRTRRQPRMVRRTPLVTYAAL